MDDPTHFRNLLLTLSDAFSREPRAGGQLAAQSLKSADVSGYRRIASSEDPSALLGDAAGLPSALPLVEQVMQCKTQLDWTCWEGEGLDTMISQRLFTTELLGPDGHIPAEDLRVGLLVSEPWTDYPVSSHSGEETYLVLSGVAEWVVGDTGYIKHRPGDFVHHPAWAPHGRRTMNDPFLGAWRWSGDLNLSTFSVK
ncbi:dimethylsulfonioproprionate lyase family protein [uncultured Roseobacter sp.]|uniref:dimethylsulfonioproprionate lyase family protein n=1 Tax=uncultured Roseobacter sp. TaxID=114847 RepID=UPI0026254317|nr:dimethylsulfonioproprionate lyase family protein [uncultured Roseobacter sp.]